MTDTILVVDDEPTILQALQGILEDEGFATLLAGDGEEALRLLHEQGVDLVLLDIWLPGRDGVAILKEIKKGFPSVAVVMMSGHGTIETAVTSTKLGAYDFIEKPLSLDKTLLVLRHALAQRRLEEENRALRLQAGGSEEILGASEAITSLKEQIALAAPSDGRVLITGENGTGKELVARHIHRLSARRHRHFVEVNCAAIPEELIESELFGHERGAFTGAVSRRQGKFELADGGTIFLDEIGDMSLKTQAKVLRVLEGQPFERIGGSRPLRADVRVIAATNKDLQDLVARGLFREDLFYRLNVIPFHVPPLRERRDDIQILASHFIRLFSLQTKQKVKTLTPGAAALLADYPWPGNIRELKNLMERLVIMVPGDGIDRAEIPLPGAAAPEPAPEPASLREARADFERRFIADALRRNRGNISRTARDLGLERSHLHKKIKLYNLAEKN